jgi:hypothetical protein
MASPQTALQPERLAAARALLRERPKRKARTWPALAAAAFAALCALTLAASMILAPPALKPSQAAIVDELR